MRLVYIFIFVTLFCGVSIAKPKGNTFPKIEEHVYKYFTIRTFELKSVRGIEYKIFIAIPLKHSPKNGYKVLYMLDANKQFPMLLNVYKPLKDTPIIVGIGYPINLDYDVAARTRDFTPKALGEKYAKGGGAENFYQFIEYTLKPFIEKSYRIDSSKQIFFGHSFGGLFGMYTMFYHTQAFSDYILASPSLWWGDGIVVPKTKPLLSMYPHSVTITLGDLENRPSASAYSAFSLTQELISEGVNAQFVLFQNRTHGGSIIDALNTALKVLEEL